VLPRGMTQLPPVVDDAGTLLFEELQPGGLESLRLQARQYLEVLGLQPTAPVVAAAPSHWRFADTAHADFGSGFVPGDSWCPQAPAPNYICFYCVFSL